MNKIIYIFFFLFPTSLISNDNITNHKIDSLILNIKNKHIPDTREAIYDISCKINDDTVQLLGVTTNKKAYEELISKIKETKLKKLYIDNIELLPSAALKDTLYGIINVSVADIRTQNRFTSGMATQALLGTPVKILEHDSWYRIQLPDTYFGWAHEKQIVPMNKAEYNKWAMASKIIFTNHYGFVYENPDKDGAIVSDIVAGNILLYDKVEGNYFKVIYPDERTGYVLRSESQEYSIWSKSRIPSADNFVKMAKSMIGIPYVWGGTSTKGFDCSGLVSIIMNLNGLTILRDASQQATEGESVDISNSYDNLQVGDLVFFGKKDEENQKENIRHVGFYLGDLKFIHASGWTRINSFDPNDPLYDELNTKEFIKATRVIDDKGKSKLKKTKDNSFYYIQR